MPNKIYYTYLWLREDGTPYYVGKGSGKRSHISQGHGVHRPKDSARILVQEFPSEVDAFAAERFLIDYYGRLDLGAGCLRNLTTGGEGSSGIVMSTATRERMGASRRGKHFSAKSRKNMSIAQLNMTAEARRNMSIARLGTHPSNETRQKQSTAKLGKKQTAKHRANSSIAMQKWWDARRSYSE